LTRSHRIHPETVSKSGRDVSQFLAIRQRPVVTNRCIIIGCWISGRCGSLHLAGGKVYHWSWGRSSVPLDLDQTGWPRHLGQANIVQGIIATATSASPTTSKSESVFTICIVFLQNSWYTSFTTFYMWE